MPSGGTGGMGGLLVQDVSVGDLQGVATGV